MVRGHLPSLPIEMWAQIVLSLHESRVVIGGHIKDSSQSDLIRVSSCTSYLRQLCKPLILNRLSRLLFSPNEIKRLIIDELPSLEVLQSFNHLTALHFTDLITLTPGLCQLIQRHLYSLKELSIFARYIEEDVDTSDFKNLSLTHLHVTLVSFLNTQPLPAILQGRSSSSLQHLSIYSPGFPLAMLNLAFIDLPALVSLRFQQLTLGTNALNDVLLKHKSIETLSVEGVPGEKNLIHISSATLPYLRRLHIRHGVFSLAGNGSFWSGCADLHTFTCEDVLPHSMFNLLHQSNGHQSSVKTVRISFVTQPSNPWAAEPDEDLSPAIFRSLLDKFGDVFPLVEELIFVTRVTTRSAILDGPKWEATMPQIVSSLSKLPRLTNLTWDLLADDSLRKTIRSPRRPARSRSSSFSLSTKSTPSEENMLPNIPEGISPLQFIGMNLPPQMDNGPLSPIPEDELHASRMKRTKSLAEGCLALKSVQWISYRCPRKYQINRDASGEPIVGTEF